MTAQPTDLVLDRIEDGDRAVLFPRDSASGEDALVLPAAWLPEGVIEGDIVRAEPLDEGGVRLHAAPEATRERRERMQELRDSIPKAPPGDLSL